MLKAVISALSGWKGYVAIALVSAVMAAAGAWKAQSWRSDAALSNLRAQHAHTLEQQAQATVASVEAARELGEQRTAAVEKELDNAKKSMAAARADAATNAASYQRLRKRVDQVLADARSLNPAFADGGATTGAPIDLLADLLVRALETAGQLAGYADQARIAGLMCERTYDGVRATAPAHGRRGDTVLFN